MFPPNVVNTWQLPSKRNRHREGPCLLPVPYLGSGAPTLALAQQSCVPGNTGNLGSYFAHLLRWERATGLLWVLHHMPRMLHNGLGYAETICSNVSSSEAGKHRFSQRILHGFTPLDRWSSIFLKLRLFNTSPHVVVTAIIKLFYCSHAHMHICTHVHTG